MHIHSYSAPGHRGPARFASHCRRLGRASLGLVLAAAAIQALPVNGEPAPTISFAASPAVPADESARVKHDPPAVDGRNAPQVADDSRLKFFGFLEFDWDSRDSGGVPGFGPLLDSPSRVAAASK